MKIYKGQSALRIVIKTFSDLTDIQSAVIKFKKPNGILGSFSAGVSDIENGIIFYECIENDIDKSGWWTFWVFITYEDGRTAAGEASKIFVWREGN
jgi:hypothetical protein